MNEYKQKKDGWCGPAALSYVLSTFGVNKSQEEIVEKTKTTIDYGVDPAPLIKFTEGLGFKVREINGDKPEDSLKTISLEVKKGNGVIVDYLVSGKDDGGHYVAFLGLKGKDINIFDPSDGKKTVMDKSYFIENWKDRTKSGKLMKNWAMIISGN